ncbi:DUF5677 domain-containing protein [[Mannheimia] succiniciproducens]|uniref:Uncharacterized protein n=1 Tax=Mannheimia succiniciproducens (strain KCTC 0769BP / MBEL55E) TaxID=221988 RepID=Q65TW4_MANSM|nr:DUF5677 domain-containing protein [[Mannheimia] succiniciproducens]AAU37596.1 unknown [[Mannheimia] succiniciproducens MBEL55E]
MKIENDLIRFIQSYETYLVSSFSKLWSAVKVEYDKLEAYSVIGGLLSRQVTLAIQMTRSPNILNGHSAPLFLRSMTDLHITLAWIMLDLEERSKKYILYGLGEEKLLVEHYKKRIDDSPNNPENELMEGMIETRLHWIDSQRRDFLVEVNLGSWSQLDYRKMAQEANCESLYTFAYKPFSQGAHNMWPHVSRYNCKYCESPLHKYHLIPDLFEAPADLDYLFRSCKYVHMAYEIFINKFGLDFSELMPLDWWDNYFMEIDVEENAING